MIFVGLIRSVLEYASPCFTGLTKSLVKKLNKIDNRSHRIIYNISYDAEYTPDQGCKKNIVELRRKELNKKTFRKIEATRDHLLHNKIPMKRKLRFCLPYCRTANLLNSFFPQAAFIVIIIIIIPRPSTTTTRGGCCICAS